jgi:hypothetical protein
LAYIKNVGVDFLVGIIVANPLACIINSSKMKYNDRLNL